MDNLYGINKSGNMIKVTHRNSFYLTWVRDVTSTTQKSESCCHSTGRALRGVGGAGHTNALRRVLAKATQPSFLHSCRQFVDLVKFSRQPQEVGTVQPLVSSERSRHEGVVTHPSPHTQSSRTGRAQVLPQPPAALADDISLFHVSLFDMF